MALRLTRRELCAGAGRVGTALALMPPLAAMGACRTTPAEPWADGTFWGDGTGWVA